MPDAHDIDRREAIRRTALLLGGALSAPTIAGFLAGCSTPDARAAAIAKALTPAELELVATIAEHIIPQTDTPGARAAGVHRFIDVMVSQYYGENERTRFMNGLRDIDARAQQSGARNFVSTPRATQIAILTELDREAYGPNSRAGNPNLPSTRRPVSTAGVFRTMKELTLLGYYTSEIGATKELRYVQVPGRFEGCVPLKRGSRAWAT